MEAWIFYTCSSEGVSYGHIFVCNVAEFAYADMLSALIAKLYTGDNFFMPGKFNDIQKHHNIWHVRDASTRS